MEEEEEEVAAEVVEVEEVFLPYQVNAGLMAQASGDAVFMHCLPAHVVADAARVARHGATLTLVREPKEAVEGAGAVYTDVWTSMGQEAEKDSKDRVFLPYQVNAGLMAQAGNDAVFMHCLPAHRGDEVTDEVIDAPYSVVFDQAENRLHIQKALLMMLVGGAAAR